MKKTVSLMLALALCLALAAPALAVENSTANLTSEAKAAYLAVVEELVSQYGEPVVVKTGSRYHGMCGGFVVDLGDGGCPELIVACSKEGKLFIDNSFINVYTYDGSEAVLVYEEKVLASGNGRARTTYTLCQNGDTAWLDTLWEYFDSNSSEHELTHLHMEDGEMKKFTPPSEAASSVQLGVYDHISFSNYEELHTFLTSETSSAPAAPAGPAGSAPSGITVTVNGNVVEWSDAAPFIDENDRTMVPLRAVADAMGLTVSWDPDAREAAFSDGRRTIYFPIDSTSAATSDGGSVQMDTAAVIASDRIYAPIRYLAEFFGYQVSWDHDTSTVIITL